MESKIPFRLKKNTSIIDSDIESDSSRRVFVYDLDTQKKYELGAEELFLLEQLNEDRTATEIIHNFKNAFSFSISEENFSLFLDQMQEYGLLETRSDQESQIIDISIPPPKELQGTTDNILHLDEDALSVEIENEQRREDSSASSQAFFEDENIQRRKKQKQKTTRRNPFIFKLFNPEKLLIFLEKALSPFAFLRWLLIPGMIIAIWICLHNQANLFFDIKVLYLRLGILSSITKLFITLITINLLSRIVQGIVCTHFGAPPKSFYIMLLWGIIPRFFIDKTGIKDLTRRGKLWSYAANFLVRLALFALGTIIWHVNSGSGNNLGSWGLFFAIIGLISFIVVANPLFIADGYNWMTVYFKTPNLRKRAFLVLKFFVLRYPFPQELSAIEKRGLIAYAIAVIAFVVAIMVVLFFILENLLGKHHSGFNVFVFIVLFTLFLYWVFVMFGSKKRHKRTLVPANQQNVSHRDLDSTKQKNFILRVFHLLAKKMKRINMAMCIVILLIGIVAILPYRYEAGGEITICPIEKLEVFARAKGEILEVKVKEGDKVSKGQILAKISDWDLQKKIALTKLELEQKQAKLKLLLDGVKPEEIEFSKKQRDLAKTVSFFSQKEVERLKPLVKTGSITEKQFDQARAEAEKDKAELDVAESKLILVKSDPQQSEVDIIESEIQILEQELSFYKEELTKTFIESPLDGQILTKNLDQFLGKFMEEGDLFSVIENSHSVKVKILIPESDISIVKLDAEVKIRIVPYSNRYFSGVVSLISQHAEKKEDDPYSSFVRIESRILNPDGLLKTGLTGYGKIDGDTMPVCIAFTRAIARFVMIEMWSWLP